MRRRREVVDRHRTIRINTTTTSTTRNNRAVPPPSRTSATSSLPPPIPPETTIPVGQVAATTPVPRQRRLPPPFNPSPSCLWMGHKPLLTPSQTRTITPPPRRWLRRTTQSPPLSTRAAILPPLLGIVPAAMAAAEVSPHTGIRSPRLRPAEEVAGVPLRPPVGAALLPSNRAAAPTTTVAWAGVALALPG